MEKWEALKEQLRAYEKVAVAFSGGADSAFLLYAAIEVLGREKVLAITVDSCFIEEKELQQAKHFCQEYAIEQKVVSVDVLSIETMEHNPGNRCYLCKKEMIKAMLQEAKAWGAEVLLEGSNRDDMGEERPGQKALQEFQIHSPLQIGNWWKEEIRAQSRVWGLPTAEKPSNACLASRMAYGEKITLEKLQMIAQAEDFLTEAFFLAQKRVRLHGEKGQAIARIEVMPEDISLLMKEENRTRILEMFTDIGFSYVTVDLAGFSSGSMNKTKKERQNVSE